MAFPRATGSSANISRTKSSCVALLGAKALGATLSMILALAFAALLGVPAAKAVEAVNVRTDAGAIDLTDAVQFQQTEGGHIQVSTAPGDDGIIRRIEGNASGYELLP